MWFAQFKTSTCARIRRKSEKLAQSKGGSSRGGGDVLRLAEGDEDVRRLDVEVRQLLLVQVLQASSHLTTHPARSGKRYWS